jgi:hypothetical protein
MPISAEGRWTYETKDGCCEGKGRFVRPFKQPESVGVATMHASCVCTERAAIARRVFVKGELADNPTVREFKRVTSTMARVLKHHKVKPLTLREAVYELNDAKRKRYLEAFDSLQQIYVEKRDARVAMFVKADKLDSVGAVSKKPRAIQGRSPRFNLVIAKYLKPIEHRLMAWKGMRRGVPRTKFMAKGLNQWERARLIVRKAQQFNHPMVISLDASSFDASVALLHLLATHRIYYSMLDDPEFRRLLSWTLRNVGKTGVGHEKYSIKGNRMSGDIDTGLGNSMINYLVFTTIMRRLRVHKWDFLCDGDDALLFIEQGATSMDAVSFEAGQLGFELTGNECDVSDGSYWNVEFCRSRPVWTEAGWVMARNPKRALACFGVTHRYVDWPQDKFMRFLKGCGLCELHISSRLPMVGCFAKAVCQLTRDEAFFGEEERWRGGVKLDVSKLREPEVYVHPLTRQCIELAFGITVEQQLAYEKMVPRIVGAARLPRHVTHDVVINEDQHYWVHAC